MKLNQAISIGVQGEYNSAPSLKRIAKKHNLSFVHWHPIDRFHYCDFEIGNCRIEHETFTKWSWKGSVIESDLMKKWHRGVSIPSRRLQKLGERQPHIWLKINRQFTSFIACEFYKRDFEPYVVDRGREFVGSNVAIDMGTIDKTLDDNRFAEVPFSHPDIFFDDRDRLIETILKYA